MMDSMCLKFFTNNDTFPFFIQYAANHPDFRIHTHQDFDELVIVLKGSAMHVVDGEQFRIKKGDVFVISNKTSHGYIGTQDFEICNIMFRPENTFSALHDIRKLAGFHALFVIEPYLALEQGFISHLSLLPLDFLAVKNILDMMLDEYTHNNLGRTDLILALFTQLTIFLSRKYQFDSTLNPNALINIAESVSYMENNFLHPLSIDDLAAMSSLSVRHFNRLFKKAYNTTPIHYIINLRLGMACYLLKNTQKSITDIALLSGFLDINYFSRTFKKFKGVTPKEYRG